jgi:uncharacterized protein (TIGR00255 family)
MLKSMTGFGSATLETESISISVEVKSINSKGQDFTIKLPKAFQDKELEVKNLLSQTLERGKVSLTVDYAKKGNIKPKVSINKELFKAYYTQLKDAADSVQADTSDLVRIVCTLPDVFEQDKTDESLTEDWNQIFAQIKIAIQKCDEFRIAEGAVLQNQLAECVQKIRSLSNQIQEKDADRLTKIRTKIAEKVKESIEEGKIDENRFEQELIYYIERLDISEEKVRLNAHLDYFEETMNASDANGKKLGFISQEIGREINTTGSKANDAYLQKLVVQMKEELEKIKEQTLNVL